MDVSPYDVGQRYLELHHRLHRLVDEEMAATGVSLSRAKVLNQLAEHGPMNQANLAGRLGFAPRSVTDTVESLERDGLVRRAEDPFDRRARVVAITPDGREALTRAMTAKHQMFDQIFGALDAPARVQFVALLTTIADSVTPNPGDFCVH